MKRYIYITMIGLLLAAANLYGKIMVRPFHEQVQQADLIIEGVVKKQAENPERRVEGSFSYGVANTVKVSRVYKGNTKESASITVFSHSNFKCDGSRLVQGKRYLLILKKNKSGFSDANGGYGIWKIITDESGKEVVFGNERLKNNKRSYEQLKNDIRKELLNHKETAKPEMSVEDGTPADDIKAVVEGNNEFAFGLYAKLKEKESGNLFFSPYSISTALAMTWAGARGETESQMADVLHFDRPQKELHTLLGSLEKYFKQAGKKGDYELNVANALWPQKGYKFLDSFVDLNKTCYGTGLKEVDYARNTEKARKTINAWVEKRTKDKIKDLIRKGDIDRTTTLVLTNAIYFKGDWLTKFDKKNTRKADFKLSPKQTVKTDMMYSKDTFRFFEGEDVKVVDLPYTGEDLSMMVILPQKAGELKKIEEQLTIARIEQWNKKLQEQKINLFLPKFKITWGTFNLAEILYEMGMTDAFEHLVADFSGMTGGKDLFISAVLHKAFVAVDEEGTEAAAATAVVMARKAVQIIPTFRADHPFVFVIRDKNTGSVLFMGRVMNPSIEN